MRFGTVGTGGDVGDYVTMQSDGNLVIYDGGSAVWNSGTSGFGGAVLKLLRTTAIYVIYQKGSNRCCGTTGTGYIGDLLRRAER